MRTLFAILFFALTLTAHATVRPAANATWAAVNTALASAVDGDVVTIPAGSATWTNTLTITKAIVLEGSISGTTAIHVETSGWEWYGYKAAIYNSSDKNVRIRNISFDNTGHTSIGIATTGWWGFTRIDHCNFTGFLNWAAVYNYLPTGLMDHCTFVNPRIAHGAHTGSALDAFNTFGKTIGTTNKLWVIEDCTVIYTADVAAVPFESADGGAYVLRYCTITNSANPSFDAVVDAHGNQTGGVLGCRNCESYFNTFDTITANRYSFLRGSTQIHFGNTIRDSSGADNLTAFTNVYQFTEEDGYRFHTASSWPAPYNITNSYIWGTTFNGNTITTWTTYDASDYTFIQEGRDVFQYPPSTSFYKPLRYPHPRVLIDNDPPVPQPFMLVTPMNGAAVGTTPTLTWNASDIPTSYQVQISTNYFFAPKIYTASVASSVRTHTVPAGTLANNTVYFWRVMAVGANGTTESGTITTADVRYFSTDNSAPPPPPVPGTISFAPVVYSATPTSAPVTISVTRTVGTNGAVSVNWATADGTALAGHDYTATNGTLSWVDGASASQSFSVTLLNSGDTGTSNRVFNVQLSAISGGASYGDTNATVAITLPLPAPPPVVTNTPSIMFELGSTNAYETIGIKTINIWRLGDGTPQTSTIAYASSNGTAVAGVDYTAISGTVTFNGNSTNVAINLPVIYRPGHQGDRVCYVTLSSPTNANLTTPSVFNFTIIDSDVSPSTILRAATIRKATIR